MRHDWHYVEELAKTPRIIGRMIRLEQIDPNPEQPRTEIGDLSDLAASIKDKGVLEPLLVKPLPQQQRWLIIAGERRWRAARLAGLTEVPCIELDVDASQIAEIALIENLQRKDLNVWEEADGLAALCQRFGYTHEDVARRIGKSRSTVTESLTIASLPQSIRERCRQAKIGSKSTVLQIARQFDEAAMLDAIRAFENSQAALLKTVKAPLTEARSSAARSNDASENGVFEQDGDFRPEHNGALGGQEGLALDSRANGSVPSSVAMARTDSRGLLTDLSAPVRAYTYQPPAGAFKLALKFKKPADKTEIILALKEILSRLEED